MFNQTILLIIIGVNILLLGISAVNSLRRRHVLNFLIALSAASLLLLETAKFCAILGLGFADKLFGLGLCLLPLSWLIASTLFLPPKTHAQGRTVLSPVLAFFSLVFLLIWWVKPFFAVDASLKLSKLAQYFFVVLIFNLTVTLSNLERSLYYLKRKNIRLLLAAALFLLMPYILLGTYAVFFSQLATSFLMGSSASILAGSFLLVTALRKDISAQAGSEETAVHASLTLFLVGGYLFVVGAFIKLFQLFGWNLNTLFSFLTTLFILGVLLFLIFSSTLKERLKTSLFKHFTRQKYDWQKIWEEFTYKISLVTDIEKIKANIEEAIAKIMNLEKARVFIFDREIPFEEEFAGWLLRRADVFSVKEVSEKGVFQKFPQAVRFFNDNSIETAAPLYGEKKIIGLISLKMADKAFLDRELLKILTLQASAVIVNCWANQALREMEKKESMYKVSSFVIHDVKNYINNLSLLISNRDKFSNTEFQQDAFITLKATIDKMKRLMEEFKALRGDLTLDKKECSLNNLIEEALADSGITRQKEIVVSKKLDGNLNIYADSYYLNKVMVNLFINAAEAMPGGGKLSIETAVAGKETLIYIRDTGCGMPQGFIKTKLFKPFASTKSKGLGIGLYQCQSIIQAHGGVIEAESVEGEGTTFRVKIPLTREAIKVIQ